MTIDDDLAAILQRESRQKGLPFKQLVNAALRRGLVQDQAMQPVPRVVTRPHAFGFKPGIDLEKLNQLADELEAEAFSANHQQQR
ncbi:MAG TPA: antitoxin [Verrucomicrobiota bacterium]|nr:antitoxin [Verrucomicrobiota bacterium]HNU49457.1 antitoxin [Verrucomicrobiota bacterium]